MCVANLNIEYAIHVQYPQQLRIPKRVGLLNLNLFVHIRGSIVLSMRDHNFSAPLCDFIGQ